VNWERSRNQQPTHAAKKYKIQIQILSISSRSASVGSCGYIPSSPILVTLMVETLSSSETSVLKIATWRNIAEDGILFSHRCENLKSYIISFVRSVLRL
jgi:hypothetical protein